MGVGGRSCVIWGSHDLVCAFLHIFCSLFYRAKERVFCFVLFYSCDELIGYKMLRKHIVGDTNTQWGISNSLS